MTNDPNDDPDRDPAVAALAALEAEMAHVLDAGRAPRSLDDVDLVAGVRAHVDRAGHARTMPLSLLLSAASLAALFAIGRIGPEPGRAAAADPDADFRTKGTRAGVDAGGAAGFAVYVARGEGAPLEPVRDGDTIGAADGLAFAVVGPPSFRRVTITAVDAVGGTHAFYVDAPATPGELPDLIRDDLPPGDLVIRASFDGTASRTITLRVRP